MERIVCIRAVKTVSIEYVTDSTEAVCATCKMEESMIKVCVLMRYHIYSTA